MDLYKIDDINQHSLCAGKTQMYFLKTAFFLAKDLIPFATGFAVCRITKVRSFAKGNGATISCQFDLPRSLYSNINKC
jgi:hypothetical protein